LELLGPAFTIALLGAIESLLSAVVADGLGNTCHQPNQELIGQGLANIFCPLFGGFAATGAIARTATNIRNGGNSPLAAIVHSLTLIMIILLFSPLVTYIPLATLAAILFVVAYNMSELHHFIFLLKHAPRHDILILLATFVLTIVTDLVIAVNVGVILALLFVVRRMSQSVSLDLEDAQTLQTELSANDLSTLPQEIAVYTIQGPFFFGSVANLKNKLLSVSNRDFKIVIFRLKGVPFMDVTGLEIFQEIVKQFHRQNVQVFLCEANSRVNRKISKINMLPWVQGNCIFLSLSEILKLIRPSVVHKH
jgi:SulP family sulfate permease